MYVRPSFKTKKALRMALADGQRVTIFEPGGWPIDPAKTRHSIEGPNFEMHRWYAVVQVDANGVVTKVVS